MRFPVPERFTPRFLLIFGALVFLGQQIEGSDFVFSVLTVAFIWIWGIAFNLAGGIEFPSGAFLFFNGLLTVIVGLVVKIFLFQPADRNLLSPRITMSCYCVGMAGMAVAAMFCRGLRPRTCLLKGFASLEQMRQGAIACLVMSLLLGSTSALSTASSGSIASAISQINRFPIMAIILATAYEIQISNGKRNSNWLVWATVAFTTAQGLVYFSKEGILFGTVAWLITSVLYRFNFPKMQLAICAAGFAFTLYYLVPYSQLVRNYGGTTGAQNFAVAMQYLGDLNGTRKAYEDLMGEYDIGNEPHLYDQREGFLDRIIMLPPDDALIDYTHKGNVFGLEPTIDAYANIIPHFIWRDKKTINIGNEYGHELNELAEDDVTTGVSFSPVADAYHEEEWLGLLLLLPVTTFIAFIVMDSVAGSSNYSVWAILPILELTHVAAEAGIGGSIYLSTYWVIAIVFTYWCSRFAAPLVMGVVRRHRGQQGKTPGFPASAPTPVSASLD